MASAIDNNEFVPFYQPIYDLNSQSIVGCEALLRWKAADGKIISPNVFIDALEHSPLILDVGQHVLEKCIRDLVNLYHAIPNGLCEDFFASVNVSGRQFADPQFIARLETVRAQSGISARHIKLEVTERIMTEGPIAIATLQNCRALGYKIAIDDFGTGFSSLQYLAAMPLHDLKVDRTFIAQMMSSEKALSIVKTLIHLATHLNLNLIAEGIETQEQLLLLLISSNTFVYGTLSQVMTFRPFLDMKLSTSNPRSDRTGHRRSSYAEPHDQPQIEPPIKPLGERASRPDGTRSDSLVRRL
jgi:EAL domain-containing protein (putative c-di-GMP-specific phosphodiesterase class I)